jgi:type IV pilus assembly protein PilA
MANQPPYLNPQQPPPPKKTSSCLIIGIVILAVSVPLIGVVAALGIYGVRRYLVAAKTAEAKNTIGAITRGAAAAYERDTVVGGRASHRLCASATPVPAVVPPAKKYMPGASDFGGSATAGWSCLKFSLTEPFYYQYHYQQGSGWVAPEIAPGPDGFEAAAVGDLDGNGIHSRFARSGKVVNGAVVVSTEMFIDKEME